MQRNAHFRRVGVVHGFTLLELLITLAVSLIVLAIGIPALVSLSARGQQTAEINSFARQLQLARSYAIKTGVDHVLCPSKDMSLCLQGSTWDQGYILFEDQDRDGSRSPTERLLQVNRPTGEIGIAMQSTNGRMRVVYRADGRSAGSNLTLTFCDPHHHIDPKAIILSNMGRARVSTTHWDGSPLNCP